MNNEKFNVDNKTVFKNIYKINQTELEKLWNWMQAPNSLHQFEAVINNLMRLFQVNLNDQLRQDLNFSEQQQKAWYELATSIKRQLDIGITDQLHDLKKAGIRPAKGLITFYPVYAALVASDQQYLDNELDNINYLQLVCLCTSIEYNSLEKTGIINTKNSGFESALRDFREIETGKIGNIKIPALQNCNTLEELLNSVEKWIEKDRPKLSTWGDGISLLFESVLLKKDRQERNFRFTLKTQTRRENKSTYIFDTKDSTDGIQTSPKIEIVKQEVAPSVKNQLLADGIHPGEFDSTSSLFITDNLAPERVNSDKVLFRQRTIRNVRNAIVKNAQQLQNDWANPTPFEVEILLRVIHNLELYLKEENISNQFTESEKLDLKNLLLLNFYIGRDKESIFDTYIVRDISTYQKLKNKRLAFLIEDELLAIPVSSPAKSHKFKTQIIQKILSEEPFYHKDINLTDVIFIRLPQKATKLITKHSKLITENKEYKQVRLFKNTSAIDKNFNDLLNLINKRYKTRWTEKRLSLVMKMAISQCTKDQSILYVITGQETGHSVVSSYYLRISNQHIQNVLDSAYKFIIGWVKTGIHKPVKIDLRCRTLYRQKTLGSSLALPDNLVKELCQHFKHQIKTTRNSHLIKEKAINIHNTLVAYICIWLGFTTGYRAVLSPISHPNEIDIQNGLLIISDKDNEHYQHTRTIPLTLKFIEQIDAYVEHLKNLAPWINNKESLQKDLYELIHTATNVKPRDTKLNIPFLFFINTALQIKSVSPKLLAKFYPFPIKANANRHYLRSKLLEFGADAESANYFMGHWADGEEPYQKNSSISLIEITNEILPYINKLEKLAGWSVQKGLAHV